MTKVGLLQSLVQAEGGCPDGLLQVMLLSTAAAGVRVSARADGRSTLLLCSRVPHTMCHAARPAETSPGLQLHSSLLHVLSGRFSLFP